ncbi:MAG: TIGR00366 family protein, partial [Firmicutes bacterium]|nr:TIGR00366 family protein [Bacillota bacterium]
SSSILNMIIPSGGGKFSVEAPIYIPVVQELGGITDPEDIGLLIKTMNAAMWGDATTNLVQPFWALPLLAIANLGIRDIMGYCAIICFYGIVMIEIFLYVLV